MKKFLLGLFFCVLLSGCISPNLNPFNWFTPESKNKKQQENIARIENKIQKNTDAEVESARGNIYGTGIALDLDPDPSRFSKIAASLNDRAQLTLGNPSLETANIMKQIVYDLVSTNEQIIRRGEKLLKERDNIIIQLQKENENLESKLEVSEDKLKKTATENASLATTLVKAKRYFWFILYFILGIFLFRTLSCVLPPPYNSLGYIADGAIALFIKPFFKLLPKVGEYVNVVSKEELTKKEDALKALITSIEEMKRKSAADFKEKLEPALKTHLDQDSSHTIYMTRKDLKLK